MKLVYLSICCLLLSMTLLACVQSDTNAVIKKVPYSIELKNWEFRRAPKGKWFKTSVPTSVHAALYDDNEIEDPFYRNNEKKLQWIEDENWEFQSTFDLDSVFFKRDFVYLNFEGLDTYADIYLNGEKLGAADNMFRSWRYDVKNKLKTKNNLLHLVFYSATKKDDRKMAELGYELPGGKRVFTRKAQFHYGWDWGPRFVTTGIWKSVQLKSFDDAHFEDVYIQQKELTDESANIEAQLKINSQHYQEAKVAVTVGDEYVEKNVSLAKGINTISLDVNITDPIRWWSNGLGEPHLYPVKTTLSINRKMADMDQKKIGLRTIELVTEKDEKGESFYFKLNGIPVFMKGANYIPQDIFHTRVTKDDYKKLIEQVVISNMNMLRVWGGGIYEQELFYELCDKNGILVWQDFMFACAMYPSDADFLENIKLEAEENVRRLRNHPSIALWCGNNENSEGWHRWGWQANFGKRKKETIAQGYDKVFKEILPATVKTLSPDIAYWESSPKYGRGNPQHQFEGDAHYWGVWHDAEPFEMFEQKVPRFMSEFGFQSFPELKNIESFTEEEDHAIDSEVMLVHQKHPRGNKLIKEYMERDYNTPKDFEHFLYVSQLLQAEGMRIGIEAHRRAMPYCMGSLYWQLNDCWPVASWSSIDYYGHWKALQYYAKQSFEPLITSPTLFEDSLHVYLVSDLQETVNAELRITAMDFQGTELAKASIPVTISPNNSSIYYREKVSELLNGHAKDNIVFDIRLNDEETNLLYQRNFYLEKPKKLQLPITDIKKEILKNDTGFSIKLKSDQLAKNVYISSPRAGFFSNNFFDILPNQPVTINFVPSEQMEDFGEDLNIISLVDSYEVKKNKKK